jgi:hypothetical protein
MHPGGGRKLRIHVNESSESSEMSRMSEMTTVKMPASVAEKLKGEQESMHHEDVN